VCVCVCVFGAATLIPSPHSPSFPLLRLPSLFPPLLPSLSCLLLFPGPGIWGQPPVWVSGGVTPGKNWKCNTRFSTFWWCTSPTSATNCWLCSCTILQFSYSPFNIVWVVASILHGLHIRNVKPAVWVSQPVIGLPGKNNAQPSYKITAF